MGLNARYELIAAKVESAEGVAETLTNAEAFRVVANSVRVTFDQKMIDRAVRRSSLSPVPALAGNNSGAIDFDVELVGHHTGGTAPEWAALLGPCTLKGAVEATTAYKIVPTSTSAEITTATIGYYVNGLRYLFAGCRGSVAIALSSEAVPVLRFHFVSPLVTIADATLLTLTPDTSVPAAFRQVTFTCQSDTLQLSKLDIDFGVELELVPDCTTASGYSVCRNGDRKVTGSFDPAMELVATHDFYGLLKAGTVGSMSAAFGSGVSKVTISSAGVQYAGISDANKNSVHAKTVPLRFSETSAGNDEVVITLGTAT